LSGGARKLNRRSRLGIAFAKDAQQSKGASVYAIFITLNDHDS